MLDASPAGRPLSCSHAAFVVIGRESSRSMAAADSGWDASSTPEMKYLLPLSTYSSPSRTAVVLIWWVLDPVSGSVMAKTIKGQGIGELKAWRTLQRWTGRRDYLPETIAAIAGLVSDRALAALAVWVVQQNGGHRTPTGRETSPRNDRRQLLTRSRPREPRFLGLSSTNQTFPSADAAAITGPRPR